MYTVKVLHDSDAALVIIGTGVTAPWKVGKYTPDAGNALQVVEQIELILEGTDTAITDAVSELGRWLADAEDDFHKVYLEIVTVSGGATWRSRVLAGRLEYWPKLGGVFRATGSEKVIMHITRLDEWEGVETALVLGNNRTVPHTTTGAVVNHSDSGVGDYNYLVVGAKVIPGDLPARCRLEVENKNALNNLGALYVFLNSHDWYAPTLEAEDATSAVGTPTVDANCSEGDYNALAWATAGETILLSWALDISLLNALKGREVRPMLRLRSTAVYTDLLLKIVVKWNATIIYTGPWAAFVPSQALQKLPAVRIPPGVMGTAGDFASITLEVVAWQPGAVAKALEPDFLQLMPLDGERLYLDYSGVGTNAKIIDDGMLPGLWVEIGGDKLPKVSGYGARLELPPAVGLSLHFLHQDTLDVSRIAHLSEVKVWYRARKRTV